MVRIHSHPETILDMVMLTSPTGGSDFKAAKAGTENAKAYYQQAVCGIIDWGFNAFYFEAFDEPWKPDSVGDGGAAADEKHWGAMTADRGVKFNLKC
jgi:glucan 1,3-beta-glucosidase